MRLRAPLAILALAALLCAPVALASQAQAPAPEPGISNPSATAPTRLHFHLVGEFQDFAVNTQPVDPAYTLPEGGGGIAMHSLSCAPAGTPLDGTTQNRYTTYYGFATAQPVDYQDPNSKRPRMHPERGLLMDALLDPEAPAVLDWYVTTFTGVPDGGVSGAPAPHSDPVLPNVVARATIRAGERISVDDAAYNSGALLAQGQTQPTTLAGASTFSGAPGTPNPQVTAEDRGGGKGYVYGFHIPLTYAATTFPKAEGFNVRIDLFMSLPSCDMAAQDQYVMPNAVRAHTDPAHRPGLTLGVRNPLRIAYVHPQFLGDDFVLHTSQASPWGAYDVDAQGIRLNLTGPDGPVEGVFRAAAPQRYYEHRARPSPADVTFIWPYRPLGAREGTYTAHLTVANLQGTATATATTQFEVGKELWVTRCGDALVEPALSDPACVRELQDENGRVLDPTLRAPGLQVLLVLGTLGLAAAARRR